MYTDVPMLITANTNEMKMRTWVRLFCLGGSSSRFGSSRSVLSAIATKDGTSQTSTQGIRREKEPTAASR
jgi:hypothetical protein